MKTALALRHVPFEHLGILQPLLEARGYAVRTVDVGVQPVPTDDMMDADLLIVLGGPIGAYDDATYPFIRDEAAAIARRLAARKPLLGISAHPFTGERFWGAGHAAYGQTASGTRRLSTRRI